MRRLLAALALLFCFPLVCAAAQPTDESINRLLGLVRAESLLEQTYGMMEQAMRAGIAQAAVGRNLSEEQKQGLEDAMKRITDVVRSEMSWESVKPMYVEIYRDSFSQEEVDGLIAFYESPVGASYVNKMPFVLQRSMVAMQSRVQPMMEKIRAAVRQAVEEAKAAK